MTGINMKTLFLCLFALSTSVFAQENYLARFQTLNTHINGTVAGSATLYFDGDKIKSFVRFFAGFPETWHMQNVYLGSRCPTMEDDLNLDGFIDINEAYISSGKIIIPLDGDINSQAGGLNTYPVSNIYGSYFYEKEAWKSNFNNDLKNADPNPNDNIVKLGRNEKLNLQEKVVIIQGVASNLTFPETVSSFGGRPVHQTLPVACGIFKRTLK